MNSKRIEYFSINVIIKHKEIVFGGNFYSNTFFITQSRKINTTQHFKNTYSFLLKNNKWISYCLNLWIFSKTEFFLVIILSFVNEIKTLHSYTHLAQKAIMN